MAHPKFLARYFFFQNEALIHPSSEELVRSKLSGGFMHRWRVKGEREKDVCLTRKQELRIEWTIVTWWIVTRNWTVIEELKGRMEQAAAAPCIYPIYVHKHTDYIHARIDAMFNCDALCMHVTTARAKHYSLSRSMHMRLLYPSRDETGAVGVLFMPLYIFICAYKIHTSTYM